MNRMMLRFRPIAPKPESSGKSEDERLNGAVVKRPKRKYVRVRGRQSKQCSIREQKSSPPENSDSPEKVTVTLQLLPERSERDYTIWKSSDENSKTNSDDVSYEVAPADSGVGMPPRIVGSATETLVVVEAVTDTFTEEGGVGLGFSDRDKIGNLEWDTCPSFVSDGEGKVIWVNEAYRKMVAEEEKGFVVALVVKDELPRFCPSFACRVRLIEKRGEGHKWNRIVPCDVWRMEFGGFAWKLDVNTALGLGL